ncbi:hypothetical protein K7640_21985 [Micromonospora sp. PLK6-60]|uniref:hypothetical protein n=1 Tax=Micromonospora sp. PLK6-60 TaxID=2873383 RepID=UPI001CA6423E|nr:hypothetical protein [Micromonospora sp. PLK6-60]MBY8874501.1 hypothetical protein [Micromonospora sp. PLK6-60]
MIRMTQPGEPGTDLFRLLRALAGRLPEELVAALGKRLAGNHPVEVAHAIVFAAVAGPVPLTDSEADVLIATLTAAGQNVGMAKAVTRTPEAARSHC